VDERPWRQPRLSRGRDTTYPLLKRVFVEPDLAAGLRSVAYWNLLQLRDTRRAPGFTQDLSTAQNWASSMRALNQAIGMEIEDQMAALTRARADLDTLKVLASRPGLPIIYDTNMLIAWQSPSDIAWRDTLRAQGETLTQARIVVPLRVMDELDKQKVGSGKLAERATTAIRYLERTLTGGPGELVPLRDGATLETWIATEDRAGDADLAILRCAADLAALHPITGVRVLTNDFGMQLRARQMGLTALQLPDDRFRKDNPAT
jgi:hypothetical protein